MQTYAQRFIRNTHTVDTIKHIEILIFEFLFVFLLGNTISLSIVKYMTVHQVIDNNLNTHIRKKKKYLGA